MTEITGIYCLGFEVPDQGVSRSGFFQTMRNCPCHACPPASGDLRAVLGVLWLEEASGSSPPPSSHSPYACLCVQISFFFWNKDNSHIGLVPPRM